MAEMRLPDNAQVHTVVLVNGGIDALKTLETVLDDRRYDVVFVESDNGAYSRIRQIVPDLIVLCTSIEDPRALHLLTMLRLDPQTRDLPVLVWVLECEAELNHTGSRSADDDGGPIRLHPSFQIN